MCLHICYEVDQHLAVSEVERELQKKVDDGTLEWFHVDLVSFKEAERYYKKNDLIGFDSWERKHVKFRKITFLTTEPFLKV